MARGFFHAKCFDYEWPRGLSRQVAAAVTQLVGPMPKIESSRLRIFPYQVQRVRGDNGIDMLGVRTTPIVIMSDDMIERRRNTQAALIVGNGLCGGKASVVAEMNPGIHTPPG